MSFVEYEFCDKNKTLPNKRPMGSKGLLKRGVVENYRKISPQDV